MIYLVYLFIKQMARLDNLGYLEISNQNEISDVKFEEVTSLSVCDFQFNELSPYIKKFINLIKFKVRTNLLQTIPPWIENFSHLTYLDLSENGLSSVPPEIGKLKKLRILNMSDNQLRELPEEIKDLSSLEILDLGCNLLKELPVWLFGMNHLVQLYCDNLRLEKIPPEIGNLTRLCQLSLSLNFLTIIPPEVGNMTSLVGLNLSANRLSTLPSELANLRNMTVLYIHDNPINYIPPQVARMIHRVPAGQKIYNDTQSIHNSGIQQSFRETVFRLANRKPELGVEQVLEEILLSKLTEDSKKALLEYASLEDVHSELNMTYSELLVLVWDRIRKNKDMKEILKVLDTELTDSECKCFTGRITRLVNCLNGFDTDVIINISDNEQLSNLMVLINNRYDNIEDKKTELIKAMKERGFSQEKIDEWIEYVE
jgi:Leucine-rich repeat (LRR) protein